MLPEQPEISRRYKTMKYKTLPLPLIGAIAATRGMLGAGAALLFLNKLKPSKKKKLGWALFVTGALSTIPLGKRVFRD
jgi:hypothetical protein